MSENRFVEKYYVMDPKTEDLLFDGYKIKNGMYVLIESHGMREDMGAELGQDQMYLARMNNRWCMVAELSFTETMVQFIGVYDDGTKMKRNVNIEHAWFVNIDSIPKQDDSKPLDHVIVLATENEAKSVVEALNAKIRMCGVVTLGELYQLIDLTGTSSDYDCGWGEGTQFQIVPKPNGGFRLECPPVTYFGSPGNRN